MIEQNEIITLQKKYEDQSHSSQMKTNSITFFRDVLFSKIPNKKINKKMQRKNKKKYEKREKQTKPIDIMMKNYSHNVTSTSFTFS